MIIVNTDVLVEILDRKSKIGQQLVEKIQKSNDGFAITAVTFMTVLLGLTKLQKNIPSIHLLKICNFTKKTAQRAEELQIDLEKKEKLQLNLYNDSCNCIKRECILVYIG